jgi:ribosomal protein L18
MDDIADWTGKACVALGIDAGQADTAEVLALARAVRREVATVVDGRSAKAAAIVAAYLLGVAVGRGADREEVTAQLADLAKQWSGTTCDWRD